MQGVGIWLCVFTNLLFEGLPCGENLSIGHPIIKSFQNSPSACNPAADKAGSARYPKKKHRSAFLVFSNFIRRLGFFHDSRFLVVSRENIGSFCSLSSWGPRTHLCGVLGPREGQEPTSAGFLVKKQNDPDFTGITTWNGSLKCSRIGRNVLESGTIVPDCFFLKKKYFGLRRFQPNTGLSSNHPQPPP